MSEVLSALKDLLPLWALLLIIGFAYLIVLFKRVFDRLVGIAQQQADYMKDRVDVVEKSTGIFTRTIDRQEKEISGLQDQLQRLGAGIQITRETDARLSVQELTVFSREMTRLSNAQDELFQLLASKAQVTAPKTAISPPTPSRTISVQTEISRAIRARDLSIYPVHVLTYPGAKEIVERLRREGYAASVYESDWHIDDPDDNQEGIWLGAMIPPGNAVELIEISRTEWPRLKYVHLSTDAGGPEDTHYTVFLGGSSKAAEGHLGCRSWRDDDFRGLRSNMSFDELHTYIRDRYRKSPHSTDG